MRENNRGERGSIIVLVALTLVALIGFTALAVDGGYLYYRHTQLQDIDDSLTLAAAREYDPGDATTEAKAVAAAKQYAELNGFSVTVPGSSGHTADVTNSAGEQGYMDISFTPDYVQGDLHTEPNLYFARALGKTKSSVSVLAKVGKRNLGAFGKGLVPIGVVDDPDFTEGDPITLSYGPGSGFSGNYGFVNLDSYLEPGSTESNNAGTTNFEEYLNTGYTGSTSFEVGGTVDTITGEKVGQVKQALEGREGDKIMVPLIETYVDANGVTRLEIVGFAYFYLTGYDDKTKIITGEFIEKVEVGPGAAGSSSYAAQALVLIE